MGKLISPSRRRKIIEQIYQTLVVSEREACKILGQARTMQRYHSTPPSEEEWLTEEIITLATKYGRYGYRKITALLSNEKGWRVNYERIEKIWRKERMKVPKKQPKRNSLWLNDGSYIRLRPEHKNHVWSYDFMVGQSVQ